MTDRVADWYTPWGLLY